MLADVSLREDRLCSAILDDGFRYSRRIEKGLCVEQWDRLCRAVRGFSRVHWIQHDMPPAWELFTNAQAACVEPLPQAHSERPVTGGRGTVATAARRDPAGARSCR